MANKTTTIRPVSAGQTETMEQRIARLEAENIALRAKASRATHFTLKVSEKGGVSAYGLGRFPVTLYREQWERLLSNAEQIKAFIAEHQGELASKDKADSAPQSQPVTTAPSTSKPRQPLLSTLSVEQRAGLSPEVIAQLAGQYV